MAGPGEAPPIGTPPAGTDLTATIVDDKPFGATQGTQQQPSAAPTPAHTGALATSAAKAAAQPESSSELEMANKDVKNTGENLSKVRDEVGGKTKQLKTRRDRLDENIIQYEKDLAKLRSQDPLDKIRQEQTSGRSTQLDPLDQLRQQQKLQENLDGAIADRNRCTADLEAQAEKLAEAQEDHKLAEERLADAEERASRQPTSPQEKYANAKAAQENANQNVKNAASRLKQADTKIAELETSLNKVDNNIDLFKKANRDTKTLMNEKAKIETELLAARQERGKAKANIKHANKVFDSANSQFHKAEAALKRANTAEKPEPTKTQESDPTILPVHSDPDVELGRARHQLDEAKRAETAARQKEAAAYKAYKANETNTVLKKNWETAQAEVIDIYHKRVSPAEARLKQAETKLVQHCNSEIADIQKNVGNPTGTESEQMQKQRARVAAADQDYNKVMTDPHASNQQKVTAAQARRTEYRSLQTVKRQELALAANHPNAPQPADEVDTKKTVLPKNQQLRPTPGRFTRAITSPTGQAAVGAAVTVITSVGTSAVLAYTEAMNNRKSPEEAMHAALQAAGKTAPFAAGGAILTAGIVLTLNRYRPVTPGMGTARAGVVGVAVSLGVAGVEHVLDNQQVKSGALDGRDANDRGTRRWWTTITGGVVALLGGAAGTLLGPGGSAAGGVGGYKVGTEAGDWAANKVIGNRGAGPAEAFTNAMKPRTENEKQMVSLYEWAQRHPKTPAAAQAIKWMHSYQLSRLPDAMDAMVEASKGKTT